VSSKPSDIWPSIRAQFPALRNWTYLNTATFGQLPERAVDAVNRHFTRRDQLACRDFLEWFDDMDYIRGLAARLIHCQPTDIAFITNACAALSQLLGGMDWRTGDQILTLEHEFPNQYYYPAQLSRFGVELIETPFERFYDAITPRTRVVVLSTVNYSTGFRAPLPEIARHLRARDIMLYLDGTQSLGALEFDCSVIQPDMFAVNAYKWMCSPNGSGFMYVSPELRQRLAPAVIGWRSDTNWRSVAALNHGAPQLVESAEKYEGGMLPFAPLYGMAESISLMLEIGPSAIEARVLDLAQRAKGILESAGGEVAYTGSPILAARFHDRSADALAEALTSRRILAAARHGHLRISPHFYNNEDDLRLVGEALNKRAVNLVQ
jgi:cysteine desulfurase / selenocysteine lyase